MRRIIVAGLIALIVAAPAYARDWTKVAKKLAASTVSLSTSSGRVFCSGFVIDNKRDYVMTAAHCLANPARLADGTLVDGLPITSVLVYSEEHDVAVVHVAGIDHPELKYRTKPITVGMEAASYGNAREHGLYEHLRIGVLGGIGKVDPSFVGYEDKDVVWLIFDQPVSGGMSGGPVVDKDGKVITLNQRSDRSMIALGRPIGVLLSVTQDYWRK